tara:strand:+ start:247 stop:498 length:252 start_codon:yes stop_codon:yes gene_type:complete
MSKRLTNLWNRLIPCRWEETLWGQQFIIRQLWWHRETDDWSGSSFIVRCYYAYVHDDDDDDDDDCWPIMFAIDEAKKVLHFIF